MLEIVTPATSTALVTLDEVKLVLGEAVSDSVLESAILSASAMVESYLGNAMAGTSRHLGVETVAQTQICPIRSPAWAILLDRYPVRRVISIAESGVFLSSDDWDLDYANGRLIRLSGGDQIAWPKGYKVVVTYEAGWDMADAVTPTVPRDVRSAVLDLVTLMVSQMGQDPRIKSEWVTDVIRTEYWVGQVGSNGAMPPHVVAKLDPYVMRAHL